MKSRLHAGIRPGMAWRLAAAIPLALFLLGALHPAPAAAPDRQARFASADEAATALVEAARAHDTNALLRVLGPESKAVVRSGDEVSDRQARERFIQAYDEAHALVSVRETEAVLQIGNDRWPFPIPVVKDAEGWHFDARKGKEEVLRRRIGRNELNTIQVCLAYVDAQREYAEKDRDGDGVPQYAQKVASDPGKRNGLYWEVNPGEEPSPLGPLVVRARGEGYAPGKGDKPVPYYGYYYRILKEQGQHAQGGAYSYVIKGKMIGGFALVAYPALYGSSGVMTFIVNHDGVVHQKDLGPRTAEIAAKMTRYDPDPSWRRAQ